MNRAEKRRQRKKASKAAKIVASVQSASRGQQVLDIGQSIDIALQHHAAGRLPQAEGIYQQILQADPDQPVALHLLGVIALQAGNNDTAVDLITRAVVIEPDFADAHNNLGTAFQGLGKLDEAAASYHKALAIEPEFFEAHNNLGNIRKELGDLDGAVASYRKAISFEPDYGEAYNNLGLALQALGKIDEAVTCYYKALATEPDYAEACNNLGLALQFLGRPEEAVASYHKSLAVDPDLAETHYCLGNALEELGELDEAVTSYQMAISIDPDYVDAHNNLGLAVQGLGKLDDAVESFHKALAIDPDHAGAHNNLGTALQSMGRLDEAAASYRMALAAKPDYAEAHRHISLIKKFTDYDDDIKAMEDTYALSGLSDKQRMHLAFGLGKSFEDLRQYEKAFGFFLTGNAVKRGTYGSPMTGVENFFADLKNLFTTELFAKFQRSEPRDQTPVFVLGMPRSGTTLVEQILASHSNVHGAGEVDYVKRIVTSSFGNAEETKFSDKVNRASISEFSRAGGEYMSMVSGHSDTASLVTDKMTHNFLFIGMIKLMLPNAKVIHCCRDPLDTCLSIFKNLFTDDGHHYAYDLSELGRYYNLYRNLMGHWHDVLPGFIYDVQYEQVVTDQERQTRALLAFCGLEWDDACLEFHRTDRPVETASAAQVRRPIYKDSVQSWKRYEDWLSPLLDVLR